MWQINANSMDKKNDVDLWRLLNSLMQYEGR